MDIVISSQNPDKIKEIKDVLAGLRVKLYAKSEFPHLPEVVEDAGSLLGNALKKAQVLAIETNMAVIADDTGLFIDALGGDPGIHSARYAGKECSYNLNRRKVLQEMEDKLDRHAKFITIAVLVQPNGDYIYTKGKLQGYITREEQGRQGFGYDPIFMLPETNKTLAEISMQEKNRISHRGKAFRELAAKIREILEKSR